MKYDFHLIRQGHTRTLTNDVARRNFMSAFRRWKDRKPGDLRAMSVWTGTGYLVTFAGISPAEAYAEARAKGPGTPIPTPPPKPEKIEFTPGKLIVTSQRSERDAIRVRFYRWRFKTGAKMTITTMQTAADRYEIRIEEMK